MLMKKTHRAWLLLAFCCLLVATMGTTTLLSFFTLPVSTALEVPRAAFTLYTSIMSLMVIVSMPFWGRMLPRIGIRAMVAISGAGAGLSYIAMSYFTSLWQFYVAGIGDHHQLVRAAQGDGHGYRHGLYRSLCSNWQHLPARHDHRSRLAAYLQAAGSRHSGADASGGAVPVQSSVEDRPATLWR